MTLSLKDNALLAALQVNRNSKDRGYEINPGKVDLILKPWHVVPGREKTYFPLIRVSDSDVFCRDRDLVAELREAIKNVDKNLIPSIDKAGDSDCKHRYIYYEDAVFGGQIWECDEPGCGRRESLAYSPGIKIKFPPNAYIRTANPGLGGAELYSHQSNAEGVVSEILSPEKRISREGLNLEAKVQ